MLKNLLNNKSFNGLVKGRHGYFVYNKNDTYIGRSIEKYGEFSESESELFRQICRPGDVVIDIGANIGAHTLPMSAFVGNTGQVYAFEPQPVIFQTLCANMALNSITNVHCHCLALADKKGDVFIPDIDYSTPGNYGGVSVGQFPQGHVIQKIPLDDFLFGKIDKLNFIKIDVEGMEEQVIEGAKKLITQHQPFLYVENDRIEKSRNLIELLWSLNYKLYWHMPYLFNPNNYAGDHENLFPDVASVNMLCIPPQVNTNLNGFEQIIDSSHHPFAKKD
jgi:FkbM family methyltransferase